VLAEVITVERRRRWNDADKAQIVAETFDPETSISEVPPRRHGLYSSQLFTWRKLARDGELRNETACGLCSGRYERGTRDRGRHVDISNQGGRVHDLRRGQDRAHGNRGRARPAHHRIC
jgi:transposase-like protein